MKHLDLFSGIGGFALAAEMVWENMEHIFCEIDPFCKAVLKKHWPESPIYDDIRQLRGQELGTVELITGGFPCQPFSNAGKKRGKEDDRDLWPQMFRIIKETRPRWVLGENVAGFIKMELDRSLFDLESIGYAVEAVVIPACAVGAPHRRDRVWIIANNDKIGKLDKFSPKHATKNWQQTFFESYCGNSASFTDNNSKRRKGSGKKTFPRKRGLQGSEDERRYTNYWERPDLFTPKLCGNGNGISQRLDACGNAIVPQVAAEIMRHMT